MALAKDSVVDGSGTKKVAIGAGLPSRSASACVRARWAPGPRPALAAGASMIAYFVRNQKDIVKKVGVYKTHRRF